jgi:transcriptional regulator with XRE-family HTH domain
MPRYDHRLLRPARLAAGLTQQQVADRIYRTVATYSRYEQGTIIPTARALGAIATALSVPVDTLFDADDRTDPVAAFQAELTAMIDNAPPFTNEQKARLRVLLRDIA